jgi:hypothetical protein
VLGQLRFSTATDAAASMFFLFQMRRIKFWLHVIPRLARFNVAREEKKIRLCLYAGEILERGGAAPVLVGHPSNQ